MGRGPDDRVLAVARWHLQGPRRKVFHATLFELIAIACVTLAMRWVPGTDTAHAGGLALSTSAIALGWNMAFNTLFESWERRQRSHARTVWRRMAHALLFEGGLVIMTVPVIAWWLSLGWWQALITDLGLVAFFLVYGLSFNWLFDHLFGLPDLRPASALPAAERNKA
jgi:uncharacterized membrane protein